MREQWGFDWSQGDSTYRNFAENPRRSPLVPGRSIGESTATPDPSPRRALPMLQLGTITYNWSFANRQVSPNWATT